MPGLNFCFRLNNQNAVYTQVSRGNVFTCTSVRAAILKNLNNCMRINTPDGFILPTKFCAYFLHPIKAVPRRRK